MALYPNPTTGELRWRGLPEGEAVTVRVFDVLGRLAAEQETREGFIRLDGLPAGLYQTLLTDEHGKMLGGGAVVLEK